MKRRHFLELVTGFSTLTGVSAYAGLDTTRSSKSETIRIGFAGVGGAGCTVLSKLNGQLSSIAQTIAINTDQISMMNINSNSKILIHGEHEGIPDVAKTLAQSHEVPIANALSSFDLVFILAGMGGATGTGIAPLIADISKRNGAHTVGIAITPFEYEGARRRTNAQTGVETLRKKVDSFFEINNDQMLQSMSKNTTMADWHRQTEIIVLNTITSAIEALTLVNTRTALI